MIECLQLFNKKSVLVTGHTGFKGSWLCHILAESGANVTGYALAPTTEPNLFSLTQLNKKIQSVIADIRSFEQLLAVFKEVRPEIVFHLAAQPLVLSSYEQPCYTYETNVMGTVNVLECIRITDTVRSFVNVTTDKVYENKEWIWGYRENERLNGYDPYSNSKSCAELVTGSYYNSFFRDRNIAVSTARAGNVIGGGDFTAGRIIPDCIHAATQNQVIQVRHPNSVRPYQHVLEPLSAYLLLAQKQYEDHTLADCYNVGPDEQDCVTTAQLVEEFCKLWAHDLTWQSAEFNNQNRFESSYLKLDCGKIKGRLGWQPTWNIAEALKQTIEWVRCYQQEGSLAQCMRQQTDLFYQAFQYKQNDQDQKIRYKKEGFSLEK